MLQHSAAVHSLCLHDIICTHIELIAFLTNWYLGGSVLDAVELRSGVVGQLVDQQVQRLLVLASPPVQHRHLVVQVCANNTSQADVCG